MVIVYAHPITLLLTGDVCADRSDDTLDKAVHIEPTGLPGRAIEFLASRPKR
ncbi:hypothetical protein ACFYTQ_16200 [Nocardia sp. NPDC004068]|uniref:hypothetical protein n=1 Tax=Nocardia sp. NPDC004068 TaxID=3364303 RepID=UPI003681EFCC